MAFTVRPDEKIEIIYQQTEMLLAKVVLIIMAALLIPWYFGLRYDAVATHANLFILWTLIVAIYGIYHYITWNAQKYIITSKRIIRTIHTGFFQTASTEIALSSIVNLGYHTKGIVSSIFDYGDVEIRAEGLHEPLILENVRDPQAIKDYIADLSQLYPKAEKHGIKI